MSKINRKNTKDNTQHFDGTAKKWTAYNGQIWKVYTAETRTDARRAFKAEFPNTPFCLVKFANTDEIAKGFGRIEGYYIDWAGYQA